MKKLSHTPEKAIRESAPGASNSLRSGLMIICGLLAFLLYANTLNHEYVLDDETAIVKNAFTQEGVSALPKIFSSSYRAGFDERKEGLYRPLSVALFAIEWEVAPGNPHLGHWINVLLYVLTAMILFITLSLFFANKNLLLPFVTTLLFVAHPIHTEVVANIKSSDEILCFLFSIISLWAVIKYARENRTLYLFISGITIFAGMLSKETAVTMVAVAPLTVYFFSNAGTKKLLIAAVPFIAAFVLYMAIRISVLKGMTGFEEIQIINNSLVAAGDDTTSRVATAIFILGRYLWLLIFPTPLCFDYSYNTIPLTSFGDPKTLLSLVTILALTIIAVRGWKSKSPVAWGLIFMGATLLLVSNLFFLIEATLAERFLYMPSLGFCSAITLLLTRIFKTSHNPVSYKSIPGLIAANKGILGIAGIVLLLYGAKTISRNSDWKDKLTLAASDSQIHPNSVRIRYAYGSLLVMEKGLNEKNTYPRQNYLEEGIRQLTAAVEILPDYADAWFNLGMGYKELEDYKKAITCFDNARKYMVNEYPEMYIESGVAYGQDGQYEKAFELLHHALQLDSTSSDAYNNLGLFYSWAGNYSLSLEMLHKAMELDPKDDHPLFNTGNTYAAMEDYQTAIEYYNQALTLNPQSDITWVNLGNSYGALKDYPNALNAFEKALAINPSNENARYNMGATYYLAGDTLNAQKFLPKE